MSRNGRGGREIAVPASVFEALRQELEEVAGTLQTVRALHHAGYKAGLHAARWVNREAGGEALSLSSTGFWGHLSDFFSKRGWGTVHHRAAHDAVGLLRTTDWAEAETYEVSTDAACNFSAGYLSGLFSQLAGGPVAVLEVSCRARGDDACDFAFGSETAIHDLYGRLLDGADFEDALSEL